MSARQIKNVSPAKSPMMVEARESRLELAPEAVTFHRGGIEFFSQIPFAPWVEMTVSLQSPGEDGRVHCTGVVVDCKGNKHAGYRVSMVFTGMSRQAETRLNTLVYPRAI